MSSRIWWRLADVWPLAEHAMSTPTVNAPFKMVPDLPRGATIQTGAPALIWQLERGRRRTVVLQRIPGLV